jgi:ribosomal protein S21
MRQQTNNDYIKETLRKKGLTVEVKNNDISGAMRKLKKLMNNEKILQEHKEKQFYTPPGEKRRLEKRAAIRRYKKNLAKNQD